MGNQSVSEKIQVFSGGCTLHGISVIGDSTATKARRLFWGSLVIAGFGFVIYKGTELTMRAIDPKIQTSLSVITGLPELEMPAITICNKNVFRKSYIDENPRITKHLKRFWGINTSKSRQNVNITEHILKAAHSLEETLVLCSIYGQERDCFNMFTGIVTERGYCYTFNRNKTLLTSLPGEDFGVQFLLNVKESEYFLNDKTIGTSGFKVLLHDPDESPIMNLRGFAVAPGEETFVSVMKTKYILEKSMGCYDTEDRDFVNPLEYYPRYTRLTCQQECLVKYIENTCGCRHFLDKGTAEECETQVDHTCMEGAAGNFTKAPHGLRRCECREVCERVVYKTKLSHARFPAPFFHRYLQDKTNISSADLREDVALLNVYYEELSETVIKQSYAYDFSLLGGDVGGYMGLMLGASVITLWEIVEFLVDLCRSICKKPGRKSSTVESLHDFKF